MVGQPDDAERSLRVAWDQQAADWIRWARTPGHDAYFWQLGLPHLLEMLPAPGRLCVDIGCGEGRLTRILRDRGYSVAGFDGSQAMVHAAVTHGEAAPAAVADAAALPVKARAADLAVAYMVLQDVDDLDGAVREAARVLDGGGRFCAAFVHPFQSSGDFGEPVVDGVRVRGDLQAPFRVTRPYFQPLRFVDTIERDGIRMSFHSEHRPLERYARAFEDAGLLIESIREPRPGPEMIAANPRTQRFTTVPWGLFIRAVRALWSK